jgi:hypothetical protein
VCTEHHVEADSYGGYGYRSTPSYSGSYNTGYSGGYNSGYGSSYGGQPIISLELDAQKSLDSDLRVAARDDRLADLRRFLARGAAVDARSDSGMTALMYASRNCAPKTVRFLLSSGASVNIQDDLGRTALMYAAIESCVPVVKEFLSETPADAELVDRSKRRAIEYAVEGAVTDVNGAPTKVLRMLERAKPHVSPLTANVVHREVRP